ncbi:phage holin family protein [Ligilactobacillus equi]|uniref:Holin n=1 Tax=Ligilactobacillus equi DSM 15833 = JCM 10991 TaxID=1423740 RepID=A0A0R1T5I5_9LACO|nr:phage holin family protein [Ligilactobacillus equi]KRL76608.1 hypothetical protein FC36_GL001846 [Ligilactobacillus equi DSM 15833 = JCM 10991]
MAWHEQLIVNSATLIDKPIITIFMALVAVDVATGYIKSLCFHITNSSKGLQGLIKHSLVVLITLLSYPILMAMNQEGWAVLWTTYYCVIYLVSIVENLGQMGLPIPPIVKKYVYKLSDEYLHEKNEKEKGEQK